MKRINTNKIRLVALVLSAQFLAGAHAADTLNISEKPLINSGNADLKPNIMFTMDDSGSMSWSHMPDKALNFRYRVGYTSNHCNGVFYDSNPDVDYQPPYNPNQPGNYYPNASFTNAWNDGYNQADGTRDLNSNFVADRYSPNALNTAYNGSQMTATGAVYYDYTGSITDKDYNDSNSDFYKECRKTRDDQNKPFEKYRLSTTVNSVIYLGTVSNGSGTEIQAIRACERDNSSCVDLIPGGLARVWRSSVNRFALAQRIVNAVNLNTGTTGVTALRAGSSVFLQVSNARQGDYANKKLVIRSPNDSWMQYGGSWKRGYTKSEEVFSDNDPDKLQKYANWYSYYRTRMQLMKSSVSLAFEGIDERYRVGLMSLNNRNVYVKVSDFEAGAGKHKNKWYQTLASTNALQRGTPLRSTLSKAGRLFAGKGIYGKNDDPVQYACQANYTLLTTDGYWNSDSSWQIKGITGARVGNLDGPGTPKPQFEGVAISESLADVAKYYYDKDIRDQSYGNCTGALGENVCGSVNDHLKQNMVTLTLGLGADGTLKYDPDYKTQTSGDFKDIVDGVRNGWPKPSNSQPTTIDDLWHAAVNGGGTYFSARNASTLKDSLSESLADIKATDGVGAAAAASNLAPVAGDNFAYVASYRTVEWTGNVEARIIDVNNYEITDAVAWCVENIDDKGCVGTLPNQVATNSRKIYVSDGSGSLKPFTVANVDVATLDNGIQNMSQWANIRTLKPSGGDELENESPAVRVGYLLDYLVGKSTYEDQTGIDADKRLFRDRKTILGDITESAPKFIGPTNLSYTDPGYENFKNTIKSRSKVVVVGANDGMLHAFDANSGKELWAFIPQAVVKNLPKLADKQYGKPGLEHVNFVNGSPKVFSVCTGGCTTNSATWRSILVAGLNGGGRGYYALDVTDPTNPSLLWEFDTDNDRNLGFTYGEPIAIKVPSGDWRILLTSGYNNGRYAKYVGSGSAENVLNNPQGNGRGYLYLLDPVSGALKGRLATNGSVDYPSGLAQIAAVVKDPFTNNIAHNQYPYVYGGDLNGYVWRFNLDNNLVSALGRTSADQPITTAPEIGRVKGKPVVFVGTGKYLEQSDLVNTDVQSLYAVKDDSSGSLSLGSLRSAGLVQQALSDTGDSRSVTDNAVDLSGSDKGWLVDFPSAGERVELDPLLLNGVLLVATNVPDSSSCLGGGYGWFNFFDYKTGSSAFTGSDVVSEKLNGTPAGFSVIYDKDGNGHVNVIDKSGVTTTVKQEIKKSSNVRDTLFNKNSDQTYGRRSIWRELPTE